MSIETGFFTQQDLMRFQTVLEMYRREAWKVIPLKIKAIFQGLILAFVVFVETHLVYRVFDYLSGDEGKYWSPEIMMLTSAIMIVGFHVLAINKPGNVAVRFVERCAGILIPIYAIGVALYLGIAIFEDSDSGFDLGAAPTLLGIAPEMPGQNWIDLIFENITSPLAKLGFSVGIGGLAIVNLYIAHSLLTMILANVDDIYARLSRARAAQTDYDIILRTQDQFSEVGADIADLEMRDETYFKDRIAGDVLVIKDEALSPHKRWVELQETECGTLFKANDGPDPKIIKTKIAAIEKAVTYELIIQSMTNSNSEVKS